MMIHLMFPFQFLKSIFTLTIRMQQEKISVEVET
jgi:hypothetical protein